ncbi:MAG: PAS domain S-box protein [Candidatus Heimdallarchaeaceae archaeon]
MHIIHVDDDEDFLLSTKMYLEKLSNKEIVVDILPNPKEILDRSFDKNYDAIVYDYLMSEMTGIEMLKRIKAVYNIPFILFTGKGREEVVIEALNLGATYYIKKDKDIEIQYRELIDVIKTVAKLKKAEEEVRKSIERLNKSEEKYKRLFEESSDAIFVHELDGRIIDVNQKTLDLFGYSKGEMLKLQIKDLYPERALEKSKWAFETILKEGHINFEIEFLKKNGETFFADVSSCVIELKGQKIVQALVRDVTKRTQVISELNNINNLFENMADAVIVADPKTHRFVYCNREAEKLLGYSREELLGLRVEDIHPEEVLEETTEAFTKHSRGERFAFETKIITKNGERIPVNINSALIQIEGKEYLEGVFRFISKKYRAEALNEVINQYQAIFENTGTAMLIIEEDNIISHVNKKFEILSGYKKKEIEGKKSWIEFVHKDDLERMKEIQYERRENPSSTPVEYKFRFLDRYKTVKTIYLYANLIPSTNRIIASLVDITDMMKTKQALRKSENIYQTLFEKTQVANIILSEDTTIKLINSKMEKISGYKKEEVEGIRSWTDFIPEPELKRMLDYAKKRKKDPSSAPSQYETKFITKDGDVLTILLVITQIPGTTDYIASLLDITEKKKVEEELVKQRDELGNFANLVAHDVRNSLMAMEGYLELSEETNNTKYLTRVRRHIKYIYDLLERSIQLAEAGRKIEKKDCIDLNELVAEVAELVIPNDIEFKQSQLATVFGDKNRVTQIFKNMLENAVIHGKPHTVEVYQKETSEKIDIFISNDGVRITPKTVQKVFNTQIKLNKPEMHGMFIVKSIIEAHD